MKQTVKTNIVEALLHLGAWMLVFLSPLLFAKDMLSEGFEINYLSFFFLHFALIVVFYANYLYLIPRLLSKGRTWLFALVNAVLIATLSGSTHWMRSTNPPPFEKGDQPRELVEHRPPMAEDIHSNPPKEEFQHQHDGKHSERPPHKPHKPHKRHGLLHDVLMMLLVGSIAILLRFTKRWFNSLGAMKDLEKEKMEVELKNLKSQLNPHFLFNTLNNIYALIGIDQDKAQQAVIDLSKLLRYALYEGDQRYVTLDKEVEFIGNYIKLMNLRLASSVKVTTDLNVGNFGNQPIAQMLFITLVENAFKHGVSSSKPSFIDMHLNVTTDKLMTFTIENSSFPKGDNDRSGSGIGIENLKRRLELLYPGNYIYKVEANDNTYKALLSIYLNN